MKKEILTSYWISFPENDNFPMGLGVTAFSLDDAFSLLEDQGYDYHKQAKKMDIKENITVDDLDYKHVVTNMGPIIVRGVWYPCFNIGYGAPK